MASLFRCCPRYNTRMAQCIRKGSAPPELETVRPLCLRVPCAPCPTDGPGSSPVCDPICTIFTGVRLAWGLGVVDQTDSAPTASAPPSLSQRTADRFVPARLRPSNRFSNR